MRAALLALALAGCAGVVEPRAPADAPLCARAGDGLVCTRFVDGALAPAHRWSADFGFDAGALAHGAALRTPDLDGDGRSDVCLRDADGLLCALRAAPEAFAPARRSLTLRNVDGFGDWTAGPTLAFADVDGDGRPDACIRGRDGLWCARGRGDGTFADATRWAGAPFDNASGADAPSRHRSLRYGDLDGDGAADVCMRTADGLVCALARGDHFAPATRWWGQLADDGGLATVALVDVDGDRRADVCARVGGAVRCAVSDGTGFVDHGVVEGLLPDSAVRFGDVDGDGRADVCVLDGRGAACALARSEGFAALVPRSTDPLDDADDPATPAALVDLDGDGRADLCRRDAAGLACARGDGAGFAALGPPLSSFGDGSEAARHDLLSLTLGPRVQPGGIVTNEVALENQRRGADDWWVPYPEWSMQHEIEAYTDKLSYAPGERVTVMLSTAARGDAVTWTLYRTGWYAGRGARAVDAGSTVGAPQPLPPVADARVPVRAGWQPSFAVALPADAVSGVYALRLDSRASGKSFFVTFVVRRDDRPADLLFVRADFTDEAYNDWDGGPNNSSAYQGAMWVSFDRPLRSPAALGAYAWSSGYFTFEYPMVRWLERQGYDVAYVSDVDLHQSAAPLMRARALVVAGHDEYWSPAMRDHVEEARDAGLHLGLFGSDLVDGEIRFQGDDARTFSRTVSDGNWHKNEWADKKLDPARPPHDNPSDTLTGAHYVGWCNAVHPECARDMTAKLRIADDLEIVERDHPIFRGVGRRLRQVLGYEYETVRDDADALPFRLHVLARGSVRVAGAAPAMVAYQAASGARVVDVGSMHWGHALDGWAGRALLRTSGGERPCAAGQTDCFVRAPSGAAQVTANVLTDFGAVAATPSAALHLGAAEPWP